MLSAERWCAQDNTAGNWALANHTMADALRYAGYDYRYDFGDGGHNSQHGGALFAEHLRWLFGAAAPPARPRLPRSLLAEKDEQAKL